MKRSNDFAFLNGISKSECVTAVSEMAVSADNSELNRLLRIVFAPDDNGVVKGDLSYYMSGKASPEVIQFIKDVLQQDMSSYRQPSIADGMDDDFVEDLSPRLSETKDAYAHRIREIINKQEYEIADQKSPDAE